MKIDHDLYRGADARCAFNASTNVLFGLLAGLSANGRVWLSSSEFLGVVPRDSQIQKRDHIARCSSVPLNCAAGSLVPEYKTTPT